MIQDCIRRLLGRLASRSVVPVPVLKHGSAWCSQSSHSGLFVLRLNSNIDFSSVIKVCGVDRIALAPRRVFGVGPVRVDLPEMRNTEPADEVLRVMTHAHLHKLMGAPAGVIAGILALIVDIA